MAGSNYTSVGDLAVGALLLTAVLVVWRRHFRSLVRLLGWQGVALALIPISAGLHSHDLTLTGVGFFLLALRGAAFPWLASRLLRSGGAARDSEPLVNVTAALLTVALLAALGYAVSRPLVRLDPTPAVRAAPVALVVVLIGIFVLITRRRALSQVIGFLMVDNGITALALLTTAGVPLIVELGASLDILLAVLILQALSGRMRLKFGDIDLDDLRELHD